MKILIFVSLVLAPFVLLVGCDKVTAAKERIAILACKDHNGYKGYSPKLNYLEVRCQDGTVLQVKWLP